MIDKILLTKKALNNTEVFHIVETNNLQTNAKAGQLYYNNQIVKNITDSVFIEIKTNKNLRLECSLHKYYNHLKTGKSVNFDLFSMRQADETVIQLIEKKGLTAKGLNVYAFEIGLNITVMKDCREYLDLIQGIGSSGSGKELIVNQKYKDKRVKTTEFHKDKRKYYKVYDKVFEMKDKRAGTLPSTNILRIETVFRRIENMSLEKFFSKTNLSKIADQFFRDWKTLQFERDLKAPKGTTKQKKALCKEILKHGTETALSNAKEAHSLKSLTDKQFRTIREFITHDWNTYKAEVLQIQSEPEKEFRKQLGIYEKLLKN